MVPLLIGAAAAGLVGLALSGDDKKNSTTTTTREIPSSEVPPDVYEKKNTSSNSTAKRNLVLSAPAKGQLVPLSEVEDRDFLNYGRGAAIKNNFGGRIISPFDGRVLKIFGDALMIDSNDGVELYIRFGAGFCYVHEGEQIKYRQVIAAVDPKVSSTIMVAVTNHAEFGDITFELDGQKVTVPAENFSTGDDSMQGRKFTILGETGSGKTCYLLGMYYEMSMSVAGYTVIATDSDADKNLTLRYEMLKDKSRGQSRFPAGTEQVEKYNFNLQYDYETILPFQWVDYPGGFLDATRRDVGSEQYKEVEKSIRESEMIFICIDGANLVGSGTRNKIRKVKTRCAKHINPYLVELRNKFKKKGAGLPPIGMLITKYDICKDDTDSDEVRVIVAEAFEGLFGDEDNQNIVAIIPVSLGDTLQDDEYQGDLEPLNVHLPILMGINFALIDMLHSAKAVIEEDHATVAEAESLKRIEDDRWAVTRWLFGGHDPDKLAKIISNTKEEIKGVKEVAKYFRKSLKRMNRELSAVDMIFANGSWLDKSNIRKFWRDIQQIAEYNF